MQSLAPLENIESHIYVIRGQKVMLDMDLARLYGVATKAFNRAVSRNLESFPKDFMFKLASSEFKNLRYHFGTSSWGGRRSLPYAFTEQGVAMLSSVLKSRRARQVNISIMRAFVKQRQIITGNQELARKLAELEKKYDFRFKVIFEAIRKLMESPEKPRKPIGFKT